MPGEKNRQAYESFHQRLAKEIELHLDKDGVYKPRKEVLENQAKEYLLLIQEIVKESQDFLEQKVWKKVREFIVENSTRFKG